METKEGTVTWKAQSVACTESSPSGEVYVTHCKIRNGVDCIRLLAKIGASQTVVVSESLATLAEVVDAVFQSVSEMPKYRDDVKIIMSHMAGLQLKDSFCQYAYAIYEGCKVDGESYEAIQRSGMDLFWEVLHNLANQEHPNNPFLRWLSECEGDSQIIPLRAFVEMFELLRERHKKRHSFSFIFRDVDLADEVLQILRYLVEGARRDRYADVSWLIQATIPILEAKIEAQRSNKFAEKMRQQLELKFILARLPQRKQVG